MPGGAGPYRGRLPSAPPVPRAPLAAAPSSVAQPVDPTVTGRPTPGRVPPGDVTRPPIGQPDARSRPAAGLSPAGAVLLSVGATAGAVGAGSLMVDGRSSNLGYSLIVAGLALGPSAGNLAQGNTRDALIGMGVIGMGVRAGGVALGVAVIGISFNDAGQGGEVGALVTIGSYVGGVVYDLVSAGRYAGRVTVAPRLDGRAPGAVVRVGL